MRIPQPPLSEFVDLLWLSEGAPPGHGKERILPTGTVEVVINLREDALEVYEPEDDGRFERFPNAVVCGPQSEFFVVDAAQQASLVGVHFKPGGAFPFFGVPADELHGMHVSLEMLWGAHAADTREQLIRAMTLEAKFHVLEAALLARLCGPLARHPAVAYALGEFQRAPSQRISDVTDQIGLSARRFIRIFSEEVGLTPKVFCRIRRFQQVLQRIHRREQVDWPDLALACGYFDQAHFVHEFHAFSGLNPTSYLAQHTDHLNHVPLRD